MSIRSRLRVRSRLRSAVHRLWPPQPKPLILMYHRIADVRIDPWSLAVSPAHFEEQLEVLRRKRRPLPLSDFVSELVAGTLQSDAVAVTFDDGYADNLIAGKPRLAAADVPATVFVATGYLNRPNEFWWDELARLVLAGRGPRNFEIAINGKSIHVDLGDMSAGSKARREALVLIWQAVRRLEDGERETVMSRLRSILTDSDQKAARGRAMTSEEVRKLASDDLVRIGAHTVTHPLLPELGDSDCNREIGESKSTCETLIGGPVSGFAYPYGGFDKKVREAVSSAGFAFACSTLHAKATAASDVLILPRIHVTNTNGNAFEELLHRWSAE